MQLPNHYLFSEIAERVGRYRQRHPDADIISLGIGDVTQPLAPAVVQAMHRAVDELASASTFHGYGPEQGYASLREAIVQHDYAARGIDLSPDEVFVNDGAKSDCGNIGELLHTDNRVAVTDPVYPVYVDANVMDGRAGSLHDGKWDGLTYLPCTEANHFVPQLPAQPVDIVYLCYPNNPTGTTLTRAQLQRWVDYARRHRTLIVYDSAYEAYIQDTRIPHSIYEMEGAREVAIEMRSFSKTAGFTGVRCGYTVVPKALKAYTTDGKPASLNQLWHRRQSTKFNGASYVSQRGSRGRVQCRGAGTGAAHHRLLHGECPPHQARADDHGADRIRRRQRPLPVGKNAGREKPPGNSSTTCSTNRTWCARRGAASAPAAKASCASPPLPTATARCKPWKGLQGQEARGRK